MENGTDKGKNRAIKIEEGRRKQDKVILSRCCALPQKSIQRDRNFPRMPRTMKVYDCRGDLIGSDKVCDSLQFHFLSSHDVRNDETVYL